jgi:tetratricopeptide (TPR) repeat protein
MKLSTLSPVLVPAVLISASSVLMAQSREVQAALREAGRLRNANQPQAALKAYDLAIRLDPGNGELYNERGSFYGEQQKLDLALKDFHEAARLSPSMAAPRLNAGLIYKMKGDLSNALAEFDSGLTANPNYAPLYMQRGLIFLLQGKERDAELEFQQGSGLDRSLRAQYAPRIQEARVQKRSPARPALPASLSPAGALNEGVKLIAMKRDRDAMPFLDYVLGRGAAASSAAPEAYYHRGTAYYNLRQFGLAIDRQ